MSLKVSKVQNEFMMSSFLPKNEQKLSNCFVVCMAEILTIFCSYFRRNDDFENSFWNLLTFSRGQLGPSPYARVNLRKSLDQSLI